jgi:dihydroorotate dehydrogenase (NAD+) catalytic subunit
MGGISSGRDALEFLAAGAASVALGTILFSDPGAPDRVRAELASEVANLAVGETDNAIGLAHAKAPTHSGTAERLAAMSAQ